MFAQNITADTPVAWPPWVNVTCGRSSAMLLDMRGAGRWHVLNGTAAELMMWMKYPRSITVVGEKLATAHRVPPAVAINDSLLFAQKMIHCGLLMVATSISQEAAQEVNS